MGVGKQRKSPRICYFIGKDHVLKYIGRALYKIHQIVSIVPQLVEIEIPNQIHPFQNMCSIHRNTKKFKAVNKNHQSSSNF